VDLCVAAGVQAWEFFNKGIPVPLLLRAIEDTYLGRGVFLDGKAMEDGIDVLLEDATDIHKEIQDLKRPVAYRDKLFEKFHNLLVDHQLTRKRLSAIADKGNERAKEIEMDQKKADDESAVRVFRHFPAWKCSMVIMSSRYEGRVAEHLAEQLAEYCEGDASRCLGAVMEIVETGAKKNVEAAKQEHLAEQMAEYCEGDDRETRVRGVRVILRSLPGGPDVSQIAVHFGGGGSATRAFFKAPSTAFLESNFEQPEVVLRRVDRGYNDSSCLQLEPKDVVMVMLRDQHFHQDPLEDWSWGFKTNSPKEEGWIPTFSYALYIAIRTESAGRGVEAVKEGDILVAHVQRGKYVYGTLLPRGPVKSPPMKKWFPFREDLFKRLHSSSAAVVLNDAGFFQMPEILA